MSTSKPSYAAVVAQQPAEGAAGSSGQGEAPPPYTAPSASATNKAPHQTNLPSQPLAQHRQGDGYGTTESFHPAANGGWTPPATPGVARARALRRFWLAMMWAWLIWIAVGLLIGGGISDVEANPPGRRGHWDKHSKWHEDRWGYATSFFGKNQEVVEDQVVVME